jgi:leucyl aminopeptidase
VAELRLSDTASAEIEVGALVIPLLRSEHGPMLPPGHGLPRSAHTHLREAIQTLRLTGEVDEVTLIPGVPRLFSPLVALAGVGALEAGLGPIGERIRRGIGAAVRRLAGFEHVAVILPGTSADDLRAAAEGAALGAYSVSSPRRRSTAEWPVQRITLLGATDAADPAAVAAVRRSEVLGGAVAVCRDVVNEPAALLTPSRFAAAIRAETDGTAVRTTTLSGAALAQAGYGGLTAVGAGSAHPPVLVQMSYRPPGATRHLALVGQGITAGSGGRRVRQADGGPGTTADMAGAAAVAATVLATATLRLPLAVTGWLALAENPASADAARPGEVVRVRRGTTVEIIDADAKGRLALADALVDAAHATPDAIVGIAALTGAPVAALGPRIGPVLGTHEALVAAVQAAAERAGEPVWPLPIPEDVDLSIHSPVADVAHHGSPSGGIRYAAGFLSRFVRTEDRVIPWAHLDVAGPAVNHGTPFGYTPTGATGYGVSTLVTLAENFASLVETLEVEAVQIG